MILDPSGNRRFYGVYRGTVTNSKDPENKRRIKATVPQVLGTEPTDWAWPTDFSSNYSTPPKIGQGVWVMFEGGDPSFPTWSGTFGDYKGDGTQVEITDLPKASYQETISNNVSSGKFDVISAVVDLSEAIQNVIDEADFPAGGLEGQILSKLSDDDYDTIWIDNFASQLKHEVKLGEAIAKGQAVYVSSADGTNMIVSKASNTGEGTSSKTLGLLETGGNTNAKVKVITEGLLSGLNTATANAGDAVWLGTGGNLIYGLTNKPSAPAHLVSIGFVTRANANNGEIFVKPQNGFEIEELHNVVITDKQDGDFIAWDSTTTEWINVPGATLGDTGWVTISSFSNSYSGSGSPAYRKINNVVYLRGRVSGGTVNTTAFNLPSGYRPAVDTVIAVQQFGTADINYVTVQPDGNVIPNKTSAWLSNVIFPIG